jgi:HK97 family phage portal protein
MISQMLLRGDGLAYIVRNDAYGPPVGFLPLRREQVVIMRERPSKPGVPPTLRYYINTPEGSFGAEQADMIHLPGLGFNGVSSLSVIQWGARNAIGIAMRADEFAGRFFSHGAQPQHAIKATGSMTPEQQESLRAAWAAKYQGNGPNGIPLILTEGLDITELTMSAVDAQLLESRKWQVSDIARAFGVPEFMIGATEKTTSWGTGIEQMGQGFVDYTLSPHIQRFEDELNRKLFRRAPKYVRVNVDAMMRGDATARSAYYKAAIGGTQNPAWMTPNEVRQRENLPPVPGGDELTNPIDAPSGDPNANESTAVAGA